MPLESTMICLDNSDWMRNGDYPPSRNDAQHDAAGLLCNDRLNSNPENTVGVLAMAGHGVDMLVSPTEEVGKVLACFARVKVGGRSDLVTSIQIAQLALKHRKNKNGGQRIIAFIGSPITDGVEVLAKVGKQLKKNNVAVDIISIGECEENIPKLQELVNSANTNDNSHLITVPAGASPVNTLLTSPVMYGAAVLPGGTGPIGGGNNDFDMYGGIDPAMDPELAMAIRVSTEEARAAEEARLKAAQEQSGSAQPQQPQADEDDEEAMMRRALELSLQDVQPPKQQTQAPSSSSAAANVAETENNDAMEEFDEDEELQRALALSLGGSSGPSTTNVEQSNSDLVGQFLQDADLNDPLVQAALAQLQQQEKKENEDKELPKKRKPDEK